MSKRTMATFKGYRTPHSNNNIFFHFIAKVSTNRLFLWGFLKELFIVIMLQDMIWEIIVPFS